MKRTWLKRMVLYSSATLLASNLLLGQGQWKASNCGSTSPTLDRILINSCAFYEPDEYLIFHTNQSSFSVKDKQFSVQVNVTNGPFISDNWDSNPDALEAMNNSSDCNTPLFLDPFAPPYNGVIPAQSNVMAFVQQDPQFSGSLSGLCDQEAIFVLFGNFTPGSIAKSMFADVCSNCMRNIIVNLGSCKYDIIYEPGPKTKNKGAYIWGQGQSVQYAVSSACEPDFNSFSATPDPELDLYEIVMCENADTYPTSFYALNGNNFTRWYTDLDMPPIARGPTFHPPPNLFPPTLDGKPIPRTIYVQNEHGGRLSNPIELTLISDPAPLSEAISIVCATDPTCISCIGSNITLGIDINHGSNEGGFPYSELVLSDGKTNYPVTDATSGINIIELPLILSQSTTFRILSVEKPHPFIFRQSKISMAVFQRKDLERIR